MKVVHSVLHPHTGEVIGTAKIDLDAPHSDAIVTFFSGAELLTAIDSLEPVETLGAATVILRDIHEDDLNELTRIRIEADPNGLDPHSPGAKLDKGKIMAGLVLGDFANALTEVCKVGTFGAEKYTPHGWLSVPDGEQRYTNAMLRHWIAETTEGEWDPDGLRHAAQVAWNALARLELKLRFGEPE